MGEQKEGEYIQPSDEEILAKSFGNEQIAIGMLNDYILEREELIVQYNESRNFKIFEKIKELEDKIENLRESIYYKADAHQEKLDKYIHPEDQPTNLQ